MRIQKYPWRAALLAGLLLCALSGCGAEGKISGGETSAGGTVTGESVPGEPEYRVVCTIFPLYDWTAQLLEGQDGRVELDMLLKDGSDLHSYQPTVADMVTISQADLLIYVGGESDFWVEDALKNAGNPDLRAVRLMDGLEGYLQEEEYVEGMAGADGEAHGHEHDHEHEHGESEAYDEHIWLSLKNARQSCRIIAGELSAMDEEHAEDYEARAEAYCGLLDALDEEYETMTAEAPYDTMVFGDRFPFRYLAEDYGLDYYAAFPGCSAETEASFYTISFLAEKTAELELPAVLAIDGSDGKIARTIADNTATRDQKVLVLDSMQSVDWRDVQEGENYLSVMEKNLEVLGEALGVEGRENGADSM